MILSLIISPHLFSQQITDTGWKVINKDVYKKDTSGKVVIGNTEITEKLNVAGDVRIDGLKGAGYRLVYADQEGKLKTDKGGGPPDWWKQPDGFGGTSETGAGNGMNGIGEILPSCIWRDNYSGGLYTDCPVGVGTGNSTLNSKFTIKGNPHYFQDLNHFTVMDNNNSNILTVGTYAAPFTLRFTNEVHINGDLVTTGKVLHFCTNPQDGCLVGVQEGFKIYGGAHFQSSYGNFDLLLESNNNKAWDIVVGTSGDFALYHPASNTAPFKVKEDGIVIINKSLIVKEVLSACEVEVPVTGCDFVFDENYKLTELKNVEIYINENKRLPEMESAKEMEEKGISLGRMFSKLLKKIEEIFLYMFKMNDNMNKFEKMLEKQQNIIAKQEGKIVILEDRIKTLEGKQEK